MADPLESPSFAQKALEKSEELERSLDGSSPHRSQGGALCNKSAGASTQGTWVPGAGKIVLLCLGLTAGLAFSRLKVRPDASWVAGQWPSLPKQQVGDSPVQATTSTPRLPPPVAPLVVPIIPPPAAAEVGAPETAFLSPTEMDDLRECLKPETAWGGGLASTSNTTTRDFLRGRHLIASGRRLKPQNCIQLINKYLFVFICLAVVVPAFMTVLPQICYYCGDFRLWKEFAGDKCPYVRNNLKNGFVKSAEHYYASCLNSTPANSTPIDCSEQKFVQTDLNCSMAYKLEDAEWFHYDNAKYITLGSGYMKASTQDSLPVCVDSEDFSSRLYPLDPNCTRLPIISDENDAKIALEFTTRQSGASVKPTPNQPIMDVASASAKNTINYLQILLQAFVALWFQSRCTSQNVKASKTSVADKDDKSTKQSRKRPEKKKHEQSSKGQKKKTRRYSQLLSS
eukprot:GHVT01065840.1.p1 GENE.GHVT01065840.1~~GHVT01065840.1.p1  ORF type:complete len:455 (-),score=58.02 GHVT01065840.1:199-1563(-)